jgi:hypothetical protein
VGGIARALEDGRDRLWCPDRDRRPRERAPERLDGAHSALPDFGAAGAAGAGVAGAAAGAAGDVADGVVDEPEALDALEVEAALR